METIICPVCGHEQEVDPDNDVILCDGCDHMLAVYQNEKGTWLAENAI